MTIRQAVEWLQRLEQKHGSEVEVFFDCPDCRKSFTPGTVAAVAIHVKDGGVR